jgi:hypothetical protein
VGENQGNSALFFTNCYCRKKEIKKNTLINSAYFFPPGSPSHLGPRPTPLHRMMICGEEYHVVATPTSSDLTIAIGSS